jgi:hypothetical protein
MADITLNQLLAAIRREESGSYNGNYSAHNPGGAMGAYQIMPANLPEWSREALGYSVSVATFMANPAIQDMIAQYIIGGYYNKYGAAGAAAMWFSGQPNPNSSASDGNTTVKGYVANVLSYGSSYGGSSNGSGGSVTTPAAVTPTLDPKTLASLYGLSYDLINSDKSLKKIFAQAVQQQWSADVFVAHLKNTSWWATQSDTMRQYITLKYTDPSSFNQKIDQTAFHVNQLAVAVGYGNLLGKGTTLNKMDGTLQNAVLKVLQNGWTDQQVTAYLGSMVKMSNGEMAGQAGQDYDKLFTYAYANGLTQSPTWFQDQVRGIEGGKTTVDTVLAQMRQSAASKYSAYATQIQAGQNVLDLAAPYTKAVAQLLELPDGSVDLSNKYVEQAMTAKLPAGGIAGQQMPLWQFEDQVRNDPLWRKTDNARESTAQIARQVGQIFGQSI